MSGTAAAHSTPPTRLADPTAIGLICLAIGCAALVPIAFGASLRWICCPECRFTRSETCFNFQSSDPSTGLFEDGLAKRHTLTSVRQCPEPGSRRIR